MEYKDRTGKIVHPGDIVMIQLGVFGKKSGGPTRYKVASSKKGLRLQTWYNGEWVPSNLIQPGSLQYLTIIDTTEREKS